MVAERGAEMAEWNDGRLDDLSERVDRIEKKMDNGFVRIDSKFERLERKMDEGFARIDGNFARIDDKFDALYRILFNAAVAMVVGVLGLLGVVVGLIATKM